MLKWLFCNLNRLVSLYCLLCLKPNNGITYCM